MTSDSAPSPPPPLILVQYELKLLGVPSHDKRHKVRSVRRKRRARVRVEHLLGVAMVGGDEQDVPCLFTRGVHRPDRWVCFADRFDSCGVYACVADLHTHQLPQRSESTKSGQTNHIRRRKLHITNSCPPPEHNSDFIRYALHIKNLIFGSLSYSRL